MTTLIWPARTVSVARPLAPPAAAVIVALPERFAVTRPLVDTVATVLLELDHDTACPLSVLPAASVSVAASCFVTPVTRLTDDGVTAIVLTAPVETTTVACPVAPLALAVMVALPVCAAVTRPLEETVAMLLLDEDQATDCAATALPALSVIEAVSCCVFPATRPIEPGAIVIVFAVPAVT